MPSTARRRITASQSDRKHVLAALRYPRCCRPEAFPAVLSCAHPPLPV